MVISVEHALDAAALRVTRVSIEREAVAQSAVELAAEAESDELLVCN